MLLSTTNPSHRLALLLLLLCGISLNASPVPDTTFRLGDSLPPLEVSLVFSGFPDKTLQWQSLQGKVVVLEFWATWCVPCVEGIPHLNKLAQELSSDPVVFISVAVQDDPDAVTAFLKKTPLSGWSAFAEDKIHSQFQIYSYPQTYLLDTQGHIAAITEPEFLNADAIRRVLHGQPANLHLKDITQGDLEWDKHSNESADALAHRAIVQRTSRANCVIGLQPGGSFVADGCSARMLIQWAFEAKPWNISYSDSLGLSSGNFQVAVRIPGASDSEVLLAAQDAITKALHLCAHWDEKNRVVYVLRRAPAAGPLLTTSKSSKASGLKKADDGIESLADPDLKHLREDFLAWQVQADVIMDPSLSGAYDWHLNRNDNLDAVLLRDLGLTLAKTTRPTKVLVIEPQ
jgi:uncharacterized protein (TIGR03435 family)